MFKFDLALALGKENPDAMAARIPLALLYDWMEYAKRKPFGDERADLRMAIMASSLVNIQLAKGQRRTRPIDFMPFSKGGGTRAEQTPNEMCTVLRGAVVAHKAHADKIADANANRS